MGSIFACGIDGAKVSRACKMLMKRACQIIQGSALATFSQNIAPPFLFHGKKWPQQKLVPAYYPGCFALAGRTGMFGRIREYLCSIRARDANLLLKGLPGR